MFLAGDYIGIAINLIGGLCVKTWKYLKRRGLFAAIMGMVKIILGFGKLIMSLAVTFIASILKAGWALVKWLAGKLTGGLIGGGSLSDVVDAFCAPWKHLWEQVKNVFAGSNVGDVDVVDANHKYFDRDPEETMDDTAKNVKSEIRFLSNGAGVEKNVATLKDETGKALGEIGAKHLVAKMKTMDTLYQWNVKQAGAYSGFIKDVWEKGKGTEDSAQSVMRILFESPELS
jgi:hypothetical protein